MEETAKGLDEKSLYLLKLPPRNATVLKDVGNTAGPADRKEKPTDRIVVNKSWMKLLLARSHFPLESHVSQCRNL